MILHSSDWGYLKGFKRKNPTEAGLSGEYRIRTGRLYAASVAL